MAIHYTLYTIHCPPALLEEALCAGEGVKLNYANNRFSAERLLYQENEEWGVTTTIDKI